METNGQNTEIEAGPEWVDVGPTSGGLTFGEGLWPEYCNPAYRMPDQIEVKVSSSSGDYYFPVSIVKMGSRKAYLGGYRNKKTGNIYHHASSQTPTDSKKPVKDTSNLRTRETQTSEYATRSVQGYRESGTQMERIDLRLDNKRDAIKVAKPYFTSAQLLLLQKRKTVEIQRCWRGYVARCLARRIRLRNKELDEIEEAEKKAQLLIEQREREAELAKRSRPRDNSDFAMMYNELDVWRQQETIKIKQSTRPGEERIAALNTLLEHERKALQAIHRLKITAHKDVHVEKSREMLEKMAQPHQWQLSSGETCAVQTPSTQRAKDLLDLYNTLCGPVESVDDRLDCLLKVKWTVKEFDSALTKDIAELVDREADLLNRGRPIKSMEKLRVRLGNLFLRFIENPDYNPRAEDFVNILSSKTATMAAANASKQQTSERLTTA